MIVAAPTPSRWTVDQVAGAATQQGWALPVILPNEVHAIMPGQVVWDMWPLAHPDGRTVVRDGRQLWFFLSAPRVDDPDDRHDVARIRLTTRGTDGWCDHGEVFPDGFTAGSREWSGSAVLGSDGATVTHYFTASGRREGGPRFEQRLFASIGQLHGPGDAPRIDGWAVPEEVVETDPRFYAPAKQDAAVDDRIKGFRDPGWFRDPADGREYILFTGSAAGSADTHDGVVGIARREGERWTTLPPILDATGVNSELERAHIVVAAGRYYLFWSTQAKRFAPGVAGPTGLYGMVADRMGGPWRPANGTGLVAGNPPAEPFQAYCWWVTGELEVASFVDLFGLEGRSPATLEKPHGRFFGGAPAPFFRLSVDGDRVAIV